jgi:hypothetical protein
MVLGGNKGPQQEQLRLMNRIVEKQVNIDKRVERLETLEAAKEQTGLGCITFSDSDIGLDAVKRVDVTPFTTGANYTFSTLTIHWCLLVGEEGAVPLLMQVDGLVAANYNYAWMKTVGGVYSDAGVDGATAWVIGNVDNGVYSIGSITVPLFTLSDYRRAFGEWAMYDASGGSGATVERGSWGGYYLGNGRPSRFDIFCAGTPNLTGSVYLYGWCPEMTPGGAPVD